MPDTPSSRRATSLAATFRYAQTNVQLYDQLARRGATPDDLARAGRAWQLAARLFSRQFRCSGKPFLCHLAGTAGVLVAHGASLEATLAGLVHAAYTHGDFGDGPPGATPARRARVREVVGDAVEDLLHRYGTTRWRRLRDGAVADRVAASDAADRQMLLVRAANTLEETLDGNLACSSPIKRTLLDEELPWMVAVTRSLGHGALADELQAACARSDERASGPARVAFEKPPGAGAAPAPPTLGRRLRGLMSARGGRTEPGAR